MTRKEAVVLINGQFDKLDKWKYTGTGKTRWHYGCVELYELLTAMYGPPTNEEETL